MPSIWQVQAWQHVQAWRLSCTALQTGLMTAKAYGNANVTMLVHKHGCDPCVYDATNQQCCAGDLR